MTERKTVTFLAVDHGNGYERDHRAPMYGLHATNRVYRVNATLTEGAHLLIEVVPLDDESSRNPGVLMDAVREAAFRLMGDPLHPIDPKRICVEWA